MAEFWAFVSFVTRWYASLYSRINNTLHMGLLGIKSLNLSSESLGQGLNQNSPELGL